MAGKNGQGPTVADYRNAFLDILQTHGKVDAKVHEEKKARMWQIANELRMSTTDMMTVQKEVREKYDRERIQTDEPKGV